MLILGDTNSGLAAIVAARMGIPVYHMEAGNRCYDDRVPEEINRRVIDHSSAVLMPYTERSKENLVREGIERERIFVTGNPIHEVLTDYARQIDGSDALARFGVAAAALLPADDAPGRERRRSGAADATRRRRGRRVGGARPAGPVQRPPAHRRSPEAARADARSARVRLLEPLGFFDFVRLEREAGAVLSDSGTVQEECAIFRVPNVTIRDVTERPETLECGSNILSGADPDAVARAMRLVLAQPADWQPPREYVAAGVARTVVRIVLGRLSLRRHQ